MNYRNNGEVEVNVPAWLDWELLRYKMFCCFCKRRNQTVKLYKDIVNLGHKNFMENLDIVRFIRRTRLHGIGLHYLLNKTMRNLTARLAFSVPLQEFPDKVLTDPSDFHSIKGEPFYYIANLQQEDYFKFAFFLRFKRQIAEVMFKQEKKSELKIPETKREERLTFKQKKNMLVNTVFSKFDNSSEYLMSERP